MKPYFVQGQITINIDIEIEADSLEDAEKKTFEMFKNSNGGSEDETFEFFKFVFEESFQ